MTTQSGSAEENRITVSSLNDRNPLLLRSTVSHIAREGWSSSAGNSYTVVGGDGFFETDVHLALARGASPKKEAGFLDFGRYDRTWA